MVGDARAGEVGYPPKDAALFIVHWDTNTMSFVNFKIPYGGTTTAPYYGEFIEHCTFASH